MEHLHKIHIKLEERLDLSIKGIVFSKLFFPKISIRLNKILACLYIYQGLKGLLLKFSCQDPLILLEEEVLLRLYMCLSRVFY